MTDKGDKVRVWKEVPGVPLKTVGTVLQAIDEDPRWDDTQGDIYICHLEVDFAEFGVHWVTDIDVAGVGDWRDEMYLRDELTRDEREAKTRERVKQLIDMLKGQTKQ